MSSKPNPFYSRGGTGSGYVGGSLAIDLSEVYAFAATMGAQAEAIVRQEHRAAMEQAIPVAQKEVQNRTPVLTGRLKREWRIQIQAVGRAIIGEAASTAKNARGQAYAIFVERPHRLVVWGRDTGRFTKGRWMFRDGTAAAEPKVRAIFDAAASRIAYRLEQR